MNRSITVNLGKRSYDIKSGFGLLEHIDEHLKPWNTGQKWIIITQKGPADQVGETIADRLRSKGFDIHVLFLPNGEKAKSLTVVESVYRSLIDLNCDRTTTLIALGGGVVGDTTGFVAATYMRGLPYVQIPTTLLSMVDSSIGGKTGVNLPEGKNLVGAIYQPLTVLIDTSVLETLPEREKVSGLGEIFKYGAIRDREFYFWLADHYDDIIRSDQKTVDHAVGKACSIKAEIVSMDEHEKGIRKILNFGHTVGHAIERCGNFNEFRHGEAVIIGMKIAALISVDKGLISRDEFDRFVKPLDSLAVPATSQIQIDCIVDAIKKDKKVHSGKLFYILLKGIGQALIDGNVSPEDIQKAWEKL